MTIDVINYTEEQFAKLNSEQLLEVRKVQTSKNRLLRRLEEEKLAEKYRLVKAGIFRSGIWENLCARLQDAYDAEVEMLREGLLFYLQYSGQQQNGAGYTVDYSLSVVDRTVLVKEYYIRTYDDPNERFEAFKNDPIAPSYLCEAYSSLYQWFLYDVTEH
ncbi:MAG: hypothetical protein IJF39_04095 [Clostridia bacterium]|nr:hypothetical protein [Clostridia bacterium]